MCASRPESNSGEAQWLRRATLQEISNHEDFTMTMLSRFAALAIVAVALLIAPAPGASPQVQVGCTCTPEVSLIPDTSCPCPGIIITNLVARVGKCSKVLGVCTGNSTLSCKIEGTVSETGCTGGFVDEPFVVMRDCISFDNQGDDPIDCSMTTGQQHRVGLTCKKCEQ